MESYLRKCFREPIDEIFTASKYLDEAVNYHLIGDFQKAEQLIIKADLPLIREWTESLWGKNSPYINFKKILNSPPVFEKKDRIENRMPTQELKNKLIERDGYNCVFCGIPLIRVEVRNHIKKLYPNSLKWERTNINQHAAFQAMWLQYDHLLPHSRGGNNDLENLVITCAPCNFARMQFTLTEVGIENPFLNKRAISNWDGLERILKLPTIY